MKPGKPSIFAAAVLFVVALGLSLLIGLHNSPPPARLSVVSAKHYLDSSGKPCIGFRVTNVSEARVEYFQLPYEFQAEGIWKTQAVTYPFRSESGLLDPGQSKELFIESPPQDTSVRLALFCRYEFSPVSRFSRWRHRWYNWPLLQTKVSGPGFWCSSSLLSVDDLQDSSGMIRKLREHSDPVSDFLWSRLAAFEQEFLASDVVDDEKKKTWLASSLNQILNSDSIYEEKRFESVVFSKETLALRGQNPQGKDIIRFNRLLLHDAYPREIRKE